MSVDINEIIDNAFDLEGIDRDAYLNVACAGDTHLRANVDQLLQGLDQSAPPEFMEGPIPLPNVDLIDDLEGFMDFPAINSSHIIPGQRIDAYKVVERLGQGGMGEVYLAERDDGEFKQRVAIKVVRSGMATEEVYKRFQYERQILANLSHPHIARLLFGGVTTDGLPYFVMEYVEDGVPLTEYCDTHELSIKERLELFKKVCDAVRYAQRNLVIHRDLKPSNILVNKDGVVKLLDFGIAKLLDSEMDPVTMFETTQHKAPFTPAYGAPEQVRGKGISAATDVYSLGMILYELLTGRRPYELEPGWLKPTNVELICEFIPTAPSSIVTRRFISEETGVQTTLSALRQSDPIRLKRTLHGDLDAIVMKALKKEPENRYGAVGELYEELERYLENRPVLAQNDTFRYRTFKFIQRKRSLVLVSTLAVLALVGGLVAALLSANFAKQEASRANAANEFMNEMFVAVDPDQLEGDVFTLQDLFGIGLEKIDALDSQPLAKAEIQGIMANGYLNMSEFSQAESLYSANIEIYRKASRIHSREFINSLAGLGRVKRNLDSPYEADSLYRYALSLSKSNDPESILLRSRIYSDHALILNDIESFEEGEEQARTSLELANSLKGSDLEETKVQNQIAIALDRISTSLSRQRNFSEAEDLFRRALSIRQSLLGESDPKVANTMYELANTLSSLGRVDEAEEYYQQALNIYLKVYGSQSPGAAVSYQALGMIEWYHRKNFDAAYDYLTKSLEISKSVHGEDHTWTGYIQLYLAIPLIKEGNFTEGQHLIEDALAIFKKNELPVSHGYTLSANCWLGKVLLERSQYAEAETRLNTCLDLTKSRSTSTLKNMNELAQNSLNELKSIQP
ncbi:MAG: serine/threonine-protein kinase [Rhodothermaceae bacterium]|nr:serine/threonine-protein kinase [Rhodothermaceae bacterium]